MFSHHKRIGVVPGVVAIFVLAVPAARAQQSIRTMPPPGSQGGCFGYCPGLSSGGGPYGSGYGYGYGSMWSPYTPSYGLYPGQLSRRFYTCYGYCPFWPGGNPYSSHNTKPGYPGLGLLPPQSDDDNPKEETYKGQRVGHWTKSLKNWDSHVRGQAANALAHLGPKAHDAIPDLIDTLKDSDPMVRV
jgi:hypothetical protein